MIAKFKQIQPDGRMTDLLVIIDIGDIIFSTDSLTLVKNLTNPNGPGVQIKLLNFTHVTFIVGKLQETFDFNNRSWQTQARFWLDSVIS